MPSSQLAIGLCLSVLCLAAGCSLAQVPPTAIAVAASPTSPSATPTLAGPINQAKQQWASQGITRYRIVLKFFENFLNQLETQREVIVVDGQVTSAACLLEKCPAFVLKEVFTIEDLFAVAQGALLRQLDPNLSPKAFEHCLSRLTFDTTYGFPNEISIDCPNWYDEDHSITVVSFEALK